MLNSRRRPLNAGVEGRSSTTSSSESLSSRNNITKNPFRQSASQPTNTSNTTTVDKKGYCATHPDILLFERRRFGRIRTILPACPRCQLEQQKATRPLRMKPLKPPKASFKRSMNNNNGRKDRDTNKSSSSQRRDTDKSGDNGATTVAMPSSNKGPRPLQNLPELRRSSKPTSLSSSSSQRQLIQQDEGNNISNRSLMSSSSRGGQAPSSSTLLRNNPPVRLSTTAVYPSSSSTDRVPILQPPSSSESSSLSSRRSTTNINNENSTASRMWRQYQSESLVSNVQQVLRALEQLHATSESLAPSEPLVLQHLETLCAWALQGGPAVRVLIVAHGGVAILIQVCQTYLQTHRGPEHTALNDFDDPASSFWENFPDQDDDDDEEEVDDDDDEVEEEEEDLDEAALLALMTPPLPPTLLPLSNTIEVTEVGTEHGDENDGKIQDESMVLDDIPIVEPQPSEQSESSDMRIKIADDEKSFSREEGENVKAPSSIETRPLSQTRASGILASDTPTIAIDNSQQEVVLPDATPIQPASEDPQLQIISKPGGIPETSLPFQQDTTTDVEVLKLKEANFSLPAQNTLVPRGQDSDDSSKSSHQDENKTTKDEGPLSSSPTADTTQQGIEDSNHVESPHQQSSASPNHPVETFKTDSHVLVDDTASPNPRGEEQPASGSIPDIERNDSTISESSEKSVTWTSDDERALELALEPDPKQKSKHPGSTRKQSSRRTDPDGSARRSNGASSKSARKSRRSDSGATMGKKTHQDGSPSIPKGDMNGLSGSSHSQSSRSSSKASSRSKVKRSNEPDRPSSATQSAVLSPLVEDSTRGESESEPSHSRTATSELSDYRIQEVAPHPASKSLSGKKSKRSGSARLKAALDGLEKNLARSALSSSTLSLPTSIDKKASSTSRNKSSRSITITDKEKGGLETLDKSDGADDGTSARTAMKSFKATNKNSPSSTRTSLSSSSKLSIGDRFGTQLKQQPSAVDDALSFPLMEDFVPVDKKSTSRRSSRLKGSEEVERTPSTEEGSKATHSNTSSMQLSHSTSNSDVNGRQAAAGQNRTSWAPSEKKFTSRNPSRPMKPDETMEAQDDSGKDLVNDKPSVPRSVESSPRLMAKKSNGSKGKSSKAGDLPQSKSSLIADVKPSLRLSVRSDKNDTALDALDRKEKSYDDSFAFKTNQTLNWRPSDLRLSESSTPSKKATTLRDNKASESKNLGRSAKADKATVAVSPNALAKHEDNGPVVVESMVAINKGQELELPTKCKKLKSAKDKKSKSRRPKLDIEKEDLDISTSSDIGLSFSEPEFPATAERPAPVVEDQEEKLTPTPAEPSEKIGNPAEVPSSKQSTFLSGDMQSHIKRWESEGNQTEPDSSGQFDANAAFVKSSRKVLDSGGTKKSRRSSSSSQSIPSDVRKKNSSKKRLGDNGNDSRRASAPNLDISSFSTTVGNVGLDKSGKIEKETYEVEKEIDLSTINNSKFASTKNDVKLKMTKEDKLVKKARKAVRQVKAKRDGNLYERWNAQETLREALMRGGIKYLWSPTALDGRRRAEILRAISYFSDAYIVIQFQVRLFEIMIDSDDPDSDDTDVYKRNLMLLSAQARRNRGIAHVQLWMEDEIEGRQRKATLNQSIRDLNEARERARHIREAAENGPPHDDDLKSDLAHAMELESMASCWLASAMLYLERGSSSLSTSAIFDDEDDELLLQVGPKPAPLQSMVDPKRHIRLNHSQDESDQQDTLNSNILDQEEKFAAVPLTDFHEIEVKSIVADYGEKFVPVGFHEIKSASKKSFRQRRTYTSDRVINSQPLTHVPSNDLQSESLSQFHEINVRRPISSSNNEFVPVHFHEMEKRVTDKKAPIGVEIEEARFVDNLRPISPTEFHEITTKSSVSGSVDNFVPVAFNETIRQVAKKPSVATAETENVTLVAQDQPIEVLSEFHEIEAKFSSQKESLKVDFYEMKSNSTSSRKRRAEVKDVSEQNLETKGTFQSEHLVKLHKIKTNGCNSNAECNAPEVEKKSFEADKTKSVQSANEERTTAFAGVQMYDLDLERDAAQPDDAFVSVETDGIIGRAAKLKKNPNIPIGSDATSAAGRGLDVHAPMTETQLRRLQPEIGEVKSSKLWPKPGKAASRSGQDIGDINLQVRMNETHAKKQENIASASGAVEQSKTLKFRPLRDSKTRPSERSRGKERSRGDRYVEGKSRGARSQGEPRREDEKLPALPAVVDGMVEQTGQFDVTCTTLPNVASSNVERRSELNMAEPGAKGGSRGEKQGTKGNPEPGTNTDPKENSRGPLWNFKVPAANPKGQRTIEVDAPTSNDRVDGSHSAGPNTTATSQDTYVHIFPAHETSIAKQAQESMTVGILNNETLSNELSDVVPTETEEETIVNPRADESSFVPFYKPRDQWILEEKASGNNDSDQIDLDVLRQIQEDVAKTKNNEDMPSLVESNEATMEATLAIQQEQAAMDKLSKDMIAKMGYADQLAMEWDLIKDDAAFRRNNVMEIKILTFAVAAMANLAIDEANLDLIGTAGGLEAISSAMWNHPAYEQLQHSGCSAFANLASSERNRQELLSFDGLDTVLKSMSSHPGNSDLHFISYVFLRKMTKNDPGTCILLVERGGVEIIVDAMHHHPRDQKLQGGACHTLEIISSLCVDGVSRIASLDGIRVVLSSMWQFMDNVAIQEHGCNTLANLTNSVPGNKATALEAGAMEVAAAAMMRFEDDFTAVEAACILLWNLTTNFDLGMERAQECNIFPALQKASQRHGLQVAKDLAQRFQPRRLFSRFGR